MSDPEPGHDPRNWVVFGDLTHIGEYERAAAADLEAQAAAERKGIRPLVLTAVDWTVALEICNTGSIPTDELRRLPHLGIEAVGDLYPGAFNLVEWFFIDSTGFDPWESGGAALSIGSLCRTGLEMTRENGGPLAWSIFGPGAWQIHVAAWRPVDQDQPESES